MKRLSTILILLIATINIGLAQEANYLCFKADGVNSSFSLQKKGNPNVPKLEYSSDKQNWQNLGIEEIITIKNGDCVYLRGNNLTKGINSTTDDYVKFEMTGKIAASGNIMSLLDNIGSSQSIFVNYCFFKLFENCANLTTAPELGATFLSQGCYDSMFYGCTGLTEPPYLPAYIEPEGCYRYMFANCENLRHMAKRGNKGKFGNRNKHMYMNCVNLESPYEKYKDIKDKKRLSKILDSLDKASIKLLEEEDYDGCANAYMEALVIAKKSLEKWEFNKNYSSPSNKSYTNFISNTQKLPDNCIFLQANSLNNNNCDYYVQIAGLMRIWHSDRNYLIDEMACKKLLLYLSRLNDEYDHHHKLDNTFIDDIIQSVLLFGPNCDSDFARNLARLRQNYARANNDTISFNNYGMIIEIHSNNSSVEKFRVFYDAAAYHMAEISGTHLTVLDYHKRMALELIDSCDHYINDSVYAKISLKDYLMLKGDIYEANYKHGEAVECYRKAINATKRPIEEIRKLYGILRTQGALDEELQIYRNRLREIFQEYEGNKEMYLETMKMIYEDEGKYDSAISVTKLLTKCKSFTFFGKTADPKLWEYSKLIPLYSKTDNNTEIERILNELKEHKSDLSNELNAIHMAVIYIQCANYYSRNSINNWKKAHEMMMEANKYYNYAEIKRGLASTHLSLKEYKNTINWINLIISDYKYNDNLYLLKGIAEMLQGDHTQAENDFTNCMEALRSEIIDKFKYLNSYEFDKYWQDKNSINMLLWSAYLNKNNLSNDYINRLFNSVLLGKNINYMSHLSVKKAQIGNPDLYGRIVTLKKALEENSDLTTDTKIKYLDAINRFERQLSEKSIEFNKVNEMLSVDFNRIKKQLKKGDLAVEFAKITDYYPEIKYSIPDSCKNYYFAFAFTRDSQHPELIELFTQEELDNYIVKGYRKDMTFKEAYDKRNTHASDKDREKYIKAIYNDSLFTQFIWGKILDKFPKSKRIYFSPTGSLFTTAIEHLKTSEGRCMADDYEMHRLSVTAQLAMPKEKNALKSAVLWGGINYKTGLESMEAASSKYNDGEDKYVSRTRGGFNVDGYSFLPGTIPDTLQYYLSNISTTIIKGDSAVEESFKSYSGNSPDIMYIATHGEFIPHEVESHDLALKKTFLIFAGCQNKNIPQNMDDGVLTAQEISNLDLSNTKLAILSACQTVQGNENKDGLFGLYRGFKLAGVKSIIGSLWEVSDDATKLYMEYLCEEINNGKTPYEALEASRTRLRNTKGKNLALYWAPFVIWD